MAWRFKASKYKNAAPLEPKLDLHIRCLSSEPLMEPFAKVKFQGPGNRLLSLMRQLHCLQRSLSCLQLGLSWLEVTLSHPQSQPTTYHPLPQPGRVAPVNQGSARQGNGATDRWPLLPRHRLCLLPPRRRAPSHREPGPDGEDLEDPPRWPLLQPHRARGLPWRAGSPSGDGFLASDCGGNPGLLQWAGHRPVGLEPWKTGLDIQWACGPGSDLCLCENSVSCLLTGASRCVAVGGRLDCDTGEIQIGRVIDVI